MSGYVKSHVNVLYCTVLARNRRPPWRYSISGAASDSLPLIYGTTTRLHRLLKSCKLSPDYQHRQPTQKEITALLKPSPEQLVNENDTRKCQFAISSTVWQLLHKAELTLHYLCINIVLDTLSSLQTVRYYHRDIRELS